MLGLLTLAARMIEHSRNAGGSGRCDDELAAEAVGLNTTMLKVLAFVLCGIYAGIGGAMCASLMQASALRCTPGAISDAGDDVGHRGHG